MLKEKNNRVLIPKTALQILSENKDLLNWYSNRIAVKDHAAKKNQASLDDFKLGDSQSNQTTEKSLGSLNDYHKTKVYDKKRKSKKQNAPSKKTKIR